MSKSLLNPRRGRPTRLSAVAAGNATALIGLELLKAIAKETRPLSLTEIARTAGMSPSRTHRYISSLQHAGFVQKQDSTGRYEIGHATIDIAIATMRCIEGSRVTADVMRELTSKTGLCSYLCIWGSNGPTVIRNEMGDVQTAARMRIGTNLSLLTATGQIFLSFMPLEATEALLKRDIEEWNQEAPGASASFEKSMRQCDRVRKLRIAKSRGMRNPTWTAFSSPVFDRDGAFRMALTLIGVSTLFDTKLDGPIARELEAMAARLSSSMIL